MYKELHKEENSPYLELLPTKGFRKGFYYELCSLLYIFDMKGFLRGIGKERMHKKAVFYTYSCNGKDSIYSKNSL